MTSTAQPTVLVVDDEADLRWGRQVRVHRRCAVGWLTKSFIGWNKSRVISRKSEHSVNFCRVTADRERARVFAEECDVGHEGVGGDVEDRQHIFSARTDERFSACEDNVRGLVFHIERVDDNALRNGDDADAVGNFVDHPDFVVVAGVD